MVCALPARGASRSLSRTQSAVPSQQPAGRGRRPHSHAVRAQMHVPSESFGGVSPERKAGQLLRTFFTFAACKIVMAQLEGSGRGALGAYDAAGYQTLADALAGTPMRDGDAWVEALFARDELLAARVLEVRAAYLAQDFEWDQLRRVCAADTAAANTALLRKHMERAYGSALLGGGEGERGGGGGSNAAPGGGPT